MGVFFFFFSSDRRLFWAEPAGHAVGVLEAMDWALLSVKGLAGFQRLKMGTFLLFFLIYPMKYFIQTAYCIKDTYLISTL